MAKKKSANTEKIRKKTIPKSAWKPGQSGNPGGRPKDGESWAASLKWAFNLTGEQAAQLVPPEYAKTFRLIGKMQLRHALVLCMIGKQLFDPSGSLFNAMADREEGKITQPILHEWREEARKLGVDPDQLVEQFFASVDSRVSVGGSPEAEEGTGGPSEA